MSTPAKASDHVKPCNIAQSERHNKRDADYIKSLNPAKIYVRVDLTRNNISYVSPEMKGSTLQQHYDYIRDMVKLKTKRAMQEKDVEYTDKNGKVRVRKGCSPIRESVVNIKDETTLDDLLRYARMVESRWGIKAIQIHLHKDEGHYENPDDKQSWKPNYHAHIIWDWMNHQTGKSMKLDAQDMSEMQDMVAEALDMERGQRKSDTGHDHLDRNDFILQKQENEKKRLESEKRKILEEKDEAEAQAIIAMEEQDEAEKKAKEAKSELSKIESDTDKQRQELFSLKESLNWKEQVLAALTSYLISIDNNFRFSIMAIVDFAYSGLGGRGGKHGDFFYDEESSAIKTLMKNMSKFAHTTMQHIGKWIVWSANIVGQFNDRELRRADREVKDIADGYYDARIQRYENGHGIMR